MIPFLTFHLGGIQRSTRGRSGRDGNAPVPHMNQAIRTNINHNDSNPNIPTDLPGKNKIIMESADSRLRKIPLRGTR